jgi:hypothetical protein
MTLFVSIAPEKPPAQYAVAHELELNKITDNTKVRKILIINDSLVKE